MNTNEILKALINRELSVQDVQGAVNMFNSFVNLQDQLQRAGIKLSVDIPTPTKVYPSYYTFTEISHKFGILTEDIQSFFKNNHKIADTRGYYNKIQLIKAFRERFHTGLADTKEAIEKLYGV
jgi:hypothetical protein